MVKLCTLFGFALAAMISVAAYKCLGGDCKVFGASSLPQSRTNKASTAKKHCAEDVRPVANSSFLSCCRTHVLVHTVVNVYLSDDECCLIVKSLVTLICTMIIPGRVSTVTAKRLP